MPKHPLTTAIYLCKHNSKTVLVPPSGKPSIWRMMVVDNKLMSWIRPAISGGTVVLGCVGGATFDFHDDTFPVVYWFVLEWTCKVCHVWRRLCLLSVMKQNTSAHFSTSNMIKQQNLNFQLYIYIYMGVSKNRGTPKWMVYDGTPN